MTADKPIEQQAWYNCQVWTATQASMYLGVSLQSVYDLRNDGKLPQLTKLPGVRFRRRDVMALAEDTELDIRPFEVAQLKAENEALRAKVGKLVAIIRQLCSSANRVVEEIDKTLAA